VDHVARKDRAAGHAPPTERNREYSLGGLELGIRAVVRGYVNQAPIEPEHHALDALAQPRGTRGDGIEGRLNVGRRRRDHAEDFAGGGLLIERLGHLRVGLRQRPVLFLEFREQAHVLDRDHRLVGEGLRELDLLVREGLHFAPPHVDDPNG
jgi:hypothetical protein